MCVYIYIYSQPSQMPCEDRMAHQFRTRLSLPISCRLCFVSMLSYPEGPSTQHLRTLVPKAITGMVFGIRVLKYLVLGPSGSTTLVAKESQLVRPGGREKSIAIVGNVEVFVMTKDLSALRVQSTQIWGIYGLHIKNRNSGFGNILYIWLLGPSGQGWSCSCWNNS